MHLTLVGLSHKTAPVEIREKLTFPEHRQKEALSILTSNEDVAEAVIISTCNRTEVYAITGVDCDGAAAVIDFLADYHDLDRHELVRYLYIQEGEGTDARGIRNIPSCIQREELCLRSPMSSPARFCVDLGCGQPQSGLNPIQQRRFSYPRGTHQGRDLPLDGSLYILQALPRAGTCVKDGISDPFVYSHLCFGFQRSLQIHLMETDQGRNLCLLSGNQKPVQKPGIKPGLLCGEHDHKKIKIGRHKMGTLTESTASKDILAGKNLLDDIGPFSVCMHFDSITDAHRIGPQCRQIGGFLQSCD